MVHYAFCILFPFYDVFVSALKNGINVINFIFVAAMK